MRTVLAALSVAGLITMNTACAQAPAKNNYQPEVGQAGKDVIWVPTPETLIEKMLSMAKVTPNDFVIDLGAGDGRTVIAAAKKGATAEGIEYNPDMGAHAMKRAADAGVSAKAKFMKADIFESDFSKATVITMYLLPELNLGLRPKLLEMKPGAQLVSHAFTMGDWDPDEQAEVEGRRAMLWIVPAKAQGNWSVKGAGQYEVTLTQQYQKLTGTARQGGFSTKIDDGRVTGEQVSFSFVDQKGAKQTFSGKVSGNRIDGTGISKWTAERK
ncbi:MAG: class I SAM-dependent methyltransferase [Betaproteobacteria bacterium]|nr:class I SAM-dependent methyltransferase [Betaproteobacteria bacterium]